MRRFDNRAIGLLVASSLACVALAAPPSGARIADMPDGVDIAELKSRGYDCERSDDNGKYGAAGCFKDKGDEWYACDVHKGGSGTARVSAGESVRPGGWPEVIGVEEDNASDGTAIINDCDEGPEVNVTNKGWITLRICIEKNDNPQWRTCDKLEVQE